MLEAAVRGKWSESDDRVEDFSPDEVGTVASTVEEGVLAAAWICGSYTVVDPEEGPADGWRACSAAVYLATDRALLRSERALDAGYLPGPDVTVPDLAVESPTMREGTVVACW